MSAARGTGETGKDELDTLPQEVLPGTTDQLLLEEILASMYALREVLQSGELKMAKKMTLSEFFKWLAIEFDSWEGWDRFRTLEGEENIQKIEWFEVSEHMEVDYSDVVDEILEVETICLCCGQRPEACDNNGLSLP